MLRFTKGLFKEQKVNIDIKNNNDFNRIEMIRNQMSKVNMPNNIKQVNKEVQNINIYTDRINALKGIKKD